MFGYDLYALQEPNKALYERYERERLYQAFKGLNSVIERVMGSER
jgi:hypothetical protein